MDKRRGPFAARLLLALTAISIPGMAQDSAAAEALFNQGIAEMEAGHHDKACPAIEESYRLDPRAGTMYALADCKAGWGKLASATVHYSDYVRLVSRMPPNEQARHRDREAHAREQLAALGPKVPKLALVLPEGAPTDTVVKRDGVVLRGASLGLELPIDPGEHEIVTKVPGGNEHVQRVTISAGESKRVVVEIVKPQSSAGVESGSSHLSGSGPERKEKDRTWAYVAGGIGVVGVGLGAVTGLMAMGKKSKVDDNCRGTVCTGEGKSAADSGMLLGNISTVGFGIGIAGLATGAVLLLSGAGQSGQHAERPRATASRGPTSWHPVVAGDAAGGALVGVQGRW